MGTVTSPSPLRRIATASSGVSPPAGRWNFPASGAKFTAMARLDAGSLDTDLWIAKTKFQGMDHARKKPTATPALTIPEATVQREKYCRLNTSSAPAAITMYALRYRTQPGPL